MGRITWQGDIETKRIELLESGKYSYLEIANILSHEFNVYITKDMVSSRSRSYKIKSIKQPIDNGAIVSSVITDSNNQINNITSQASTQSLFDDNLYNLKDKYIMSEETKREMKRIWMIFNSPEPKKILNLSDLHAPYIDFEKVEKAIKENSDCTICVLYGDVFDGESMSVFDKMQEIDSSTEFEQVFALLDVLSTRFEHVVYIGGNHDLGRFTKYIMKNIKPGLRKYAFDRLNPIKYLTEKYPNVISINHNMLEIGDVVFKHPNGYSSVEMKTVVNENDIIYANRSDLPNPNFRAVIIGHTHDLGCYFKNGILLGESGCACYTPDYRFTNPVKRRWTTGYARIELDKDNKIIFNKTRFISLDD